METTHSNDSVLIPSETDRTAKYRTTLAGLEDIIRKSSGTDEYQSTIRFDEIDLADVITQSQRITATDLCGTSAGLWYTSTVEQVDTDDDGERYSRSVAARTFRPWHEIRAVHPLLVTRWKDEPV